jgi:hypothetical protein
MYAAAESVLLTLGIETVSTGATHLAARSETLARMRDRTGGREGGLPDRTASQDGFGCHAIPTHIASSTTTVMLLRPHEVE